jgi:hypothetical protein
MGSEQKLLPKGDGHHLLLFEGQGRDLLRVVSYAPL